MAMVGFVFVFAPSSFNYNDRLRCGQVIHCMIQTFAALSTAASSANAALASPGRPSGAPSGTGEVESWACFKLYDAPLPDNVAMSVYEIERVVVRRMQLLADIDADTQAVDVGSTAGIVERVARRVQQYHGTKGGFLSSSSTSRGVVVSSSSPSSTGATASTLFGVDTSDAAVAPCFELSPQQDHLAHMFCRIVFCVSDQWRDWFIRREELLLRGRIVAFNLRGQLNAFFHRCHVDCVPLAMDDPALTPEAKEWLRTPISGAAASATGGVSQFYTVPLPLALHAVATRRAVCIGGRAVISHDDALAALLAHYRERLAAGLGDALRQREAVANNGPRVAEMLEAAFQHFIVSPIDTLKPSTEGAICAADVEPLSRSNMPLCMKQVHDHLRVQGHLKHQGRWQYGLFLKSIGLTMADAIRLFGNMLRVKGGPPEQFGKSAYAYNIRHMYGQEGKRTNYSSLSCSSIINSPPLLDAMDCHGCPFRFQDEGRLRGLLAVERPNPVVVGATATSSSAGAAATTVRLMPSDIEDIVTDAKGGHFTRACFRYMRATHNKGGGGVVEFKRETLFRSPFEYFDYSMKLRREAAGGSGSSAAVIPVIAAPEHATTTGTGGGEAPQSAHSPAAQATTPPRAPPQATASGSGPSGLRATPFKRERGGSDGSS